MKKLFPPIYGRILFFVAVIILAWQSSGLSQATAERIDVGIVEHLDTIIPLDLTFLNEKGQPVSLRSVIDKPTIFVPVYFDCPGICPAILSGVSAVINKTGMELGKEYQVVTISFNPNDTPEKAVEMKKNYLGPMGSKHPESWMFFTGDSASIAALHNAAGYYYKRTGNDFMHPSVIIILSPAGKITRYLYGTSFLPFDVKMALVEARKGQSRPTINRVLEYCFSYDPEGRKYTLQVTKISATIIIFFAAVLFIILIIRSNRKKPKQQTS
jgi:protein SCO1/2